MNISKKLDEKFDELEKLLITDAFKQAKLRTGVPFIVLLYPPYEETQIRKKIVTLAKKLELNDWTVHYFEPGPLLYEFLESIGKSEETFNAERTDSKQLRSNIAANLFIKNLSELGKEDKPKNIIFVRRAGGFYPHVNIHSLQERLVGEVQMTTVFFIPALETEGNQYLFMGKDKTQKYRGHYI